VAEDGQFPLSPDEDAAPRWLIAPPWLVGASRPFALHFLDHEGSSPELACAGVAVFQGGKRARISILRSTTPG